MFLRVFETTMSRVKKKPYKRNDVFDLKRIIDLKATDLDLFNSKFTLLECKSKF